MNSHYAKKSYGQHFLTQTAILKKIWELVAAHQPVNLLEIGPGRGALTEGIKPLCRNFKAIEADRDMQSYLLEHQLLEESQLIRGDVLKVNFDTLFPGEDFLLCGNFPYNISSQILIKTLQNTGRIPVMIGMFQKEVVVRILSGPGNKEFGTLSVLTQLMYEGRKCFDIQPSAFNPPPKVISSVLELKRRPDHLSVEAFGRMQKLVRNAFQFRRKTLRNNLKGIVQDLSVLNDPYFDKRPEQLSPQEFQELSLRLWPQEG
ncbi:MAG TPA: 16S rRNA (adenine(1518)-N(6)/adenine(1519)-N(6))-dimethyltransferase RsmA [Saprospiraceae bacterium]|nr:16S rRNA (adenine(1518)-N(6)/adenine(1519)-N(6))-dimethyltransferase RsmA [Saprospiraceae bacterium]